MDEEAMDFLKRLTCPGCDQRVRYNGTGQAGIRRVICYVCEDCDIIYQLVIEKKGVPMFDEVERDGRITLEPDDKQDKCNLCACGCYPTPEQLED
jgi:hypothetical protein